MPDYQALADWTRTEMRRQGLQHADVEAAGGPTYGTLEAILNAEPRPRWVRTLKNLSVSLGHPPDTAQRVLDGEHHEPAVSSVTGFPDPSRLADPELAELVRRVNEAVANRLTRRAEDEDPAPEEDPPPSRRRPRRRAG